MRARARQGRRRRDGERPGARRAGRGLGGDGQSEDPAGRVELPTPSDWGDQNAYPIDAGGTGVTFLLPQALIDRGEKKIGIIRVDLAAASALTRTPRRHLHEQGRPFPSTSRFRPAPPTTASSSSARRTPARAGRSSRSASKRRSRWCRPASSSDTKLILGASLGTFSQADIAELGDFAKQMAFLWSFPPATFDIPVYKALRADLAASGRGGAPAREPQGQPDAVVDRALRIARDDARRPHDHVHPRRASRRCSNKAKDVPMLGMFGGENWTPALNHPGIFKRAGTEPLGELEVGSQGEGAGWSHRATSSRFQRSTSTRCSAVRRSGATCGPCYRERCTDVAVVPAVPDHRARRGRHLRAVRAGRGAHLPRARVSSTSPRARSAPSRRTSRSSTSRGIAGGRRSPRSSFAVIAAGAVSFAFQALILRALRKRGADRPGHRHDRPARSAAGRRREALRRREPAGRLLPPAPDLPRGAASSSRRSGSSSSASRWSSPFGLWAWTRYTRVGLAINASAQNERAVQTLGWSPDRLAALTWTIGGMLGGLRGGARRAAHRAVGRRRSRSW